MKSETITVRLTEAEKALIKRLAAEKGMTVSQLAHFIIFREYLQEVKND